MAADEQRERLQGSQEAAPQILTSPSVVPRQRPLRRHYRTVAATVASLAVGILVVLLALHLFSSSSSSTAPALSFDQAIGPASQAVGTAVDGPWTIVDVQGAALTAALTSTAVAGFFASSVCTVVWSDPSSFTVPATPSNALPGGSDAWFVFSENTLPQPYLLLTIVTSFGGAANAANVAIWSGAVCAFSGVGPIPTSPIDSLTAAAVADQWNASEGSTFLSSHSSVDRGYVLFGNSSGGWFWLIQYTTCAFNATSGSGAWLRVLVGASNGTAVRESLVPSVDCAQV